MRPSPLILRWFSWGVVQLACFWFGMTLLALVIGRREIFSHGFVFEGVSAGVCVLLVLRNWALRRWPLPHPSRGGEFGRPSGPRMTR